MRVLEKNAAGSGGPLDASGFPKPVIVHVLDRLALGGMQTVACEVIERTGDRYRHHVICLSEIGALGERVQRAGAPVEVLGKSSGKDLRPCWRLSRRLKALKPAIVQTYNMGTIDLAPWARLAGVPRVVHAEHGGSMPPSNPNFRKYQLIRRAIAPFIDVFVPVSSALGEWLVCDTGIKRDKICTIHNGVDIAQYLPVKQKLADRPLRIGSVGRLDVIKAFDVLVDAFGLLCRSCPKRKFELVLVGDGPERTVLEARIAAHGLADRVQLMGARSDVYSLLQSLDIYVCTSLCEGLALTILEAMATALPIVATRVGGNPELVVDGQTGMLVEVQDAAAVANALSTLTAMPDCGHSYGEAGRQRACRQFDIDRTMTGYSHLYDRLISRAAVRV